MELEKLKYYNRRDNTIAGPLIKTPRGKWWDIVREELYFNHGFKNHNQIEYDEDIISENLKYRKKHYILPDTIHLQRNGKLSKGIILSTNETNENGEIFFIDKKTNFKYNQFGWLANSNTKSKYDLILNNVHHSDAIYHIVKYIKEHKNIIHNETEILHSSKLCPCDNCKESRNILNSGKDTLLISDIKSLYNECINYINLPELPNFYYISNDKQIVYLGFFSMLMEIFDSKFLDALIRGEKVLDEKDVENVEDYYIYNNAFSEILQKTGINTNLIHKIETIHDLIYNSYDKKIPKLPNLSITPIKEQINLLNDLLILLGKYENIDNNDLIDYHFNDIIQEKQKSSKNKKRKFVSNELILKWLNFQIFLFKEKNILIDVSIKELSMLRTKQFKVFYKEISKQYTNIPKYGETLKIQIKI